MLSTSFGSTAGLEQASLRDGNEERGMFENDGRAMHACEDSGS